MVARHQIVKKVSTDIWQKTIKFCKAITLPLKFKKKKMPTDTEDKFTKQLNFKLLAWSNQAYFPSQWKLRIDDFK